MHTCGKAMAQHQKKNALYTENLWYITTGFLFFTWIDLYIDVFYCLRLWTVSCELAASQQEENLLVRY